MDKKVKKWFFYPYAVNLIDMKMGPPHPPVVSWNPPLVKILFHDMKNWSNDGKKSIFAILAMSQRVADILELVPIVCTPCFFWVLQGVFYFFLFLLGNWLKLE